MAFADQAGKIAVDEINSETLPHVAKIISDTLIQAAVITNGLLTGIEGERILAMDGLGKITEPILQRVDRILDMLNGGFEGTLNGNIPFTTKASPKA